MKVLALGSDDEHLYGYPILMTAGLGNMLLPWAKCVVWCHDNSARMIAPFWTKLRVGPFLRFERDKRQYQLLFKPADNHISGVRRISLLTSLPKIDLEDWRNAVAVTSSTIVQFRGMKDQEMLAGRHNLVAQALYAITRPRYIPQFDGGRPFIAVHVRLGDFGVTATSDLRKGMHCVRTPIPWFAAALHELRRVLRDDIEARIFSDGSSSELAPILVMPNVMRVPRQSAITDMLAISQSRVLIASGSAFSMWGSYVGGVPALWYPGQNFAMRAPTADECLDVEWDSDRHLPGAFVESIHARLDPTLLSTDPALHRP